MDHINIYKNNHTILNIMLLTWVGLWAINFLGFGTRIAMFGGVVLIILFLLINRPISYSFLIIFYLFLTFGAIYSAILNYHEELDFFRGYRELFIPLILYTLGYISLNGETQIENKLFIYKRLFIIISLSLFIYAFLNLIVHLNNYGEINIYNREIYDVWTGSFHAATSIGSRLTLIAATLIPLILSWKSFGRYIRLILTTCAIISLVSSLMLANRSIFVILAITFILGLLIYFRLYSKNVRKVSKILLLFLIFGLSCAFIYYYDVFGVKTFYESTNFYYRLEKVNENWLTDNSRVDAWWNTILGLTQYPMGGSQTSIGLAYAHNLWLDVAYTTGIIPLVLLLIITGIFVYFNIKIINYIAIPNSMKLYISTISIALLLNFMIEPIFSGHYHLYMVFVFQIGLMHGLIEEHNVNNVSNT